VAGDWPGGAAVPAIGIGRVFMLSIIGAGLGLILGAWTARRRGGNRLDLLHHGAVHAILGFLIGAFAMLAFPAPL